MKASVLVLVSFIFLFSGCLSVSEQEAKENCKKEGKKYTIIEQFNYRTGKVEKRIECN